MSRLEDKKQQELPGGDAKAETAGSGSGGDLGTPSHDTHEPPPSYDQEKNEVVSGGGVVDPSEDESASSE